METPIDSSAIAMRDLHARHDRRVRRAARGCALSAWASLAAAGLAALFGIVPAWCASGAAIALVGLAAWALRWRGLTRGALRVGPAQRPALWRKVEVAARRFGLAPPATYVVGSGRPDALVAAAWPPGALVLHAELVAACDRAAWRGGRERPLEIDFVIAHAVARLAEGDRAALYWPLRLLPFLGGAFRRACERTGDRAGYLAVGDLDVATSALQVLGELGAAEVPARSAALREWLHPGTVLPLTPLRRRLIERARARALNAP